LVGIDVEALRDFDPNAWASWDADALRAALEPALQTLGVQITAEELPLLIDGLTAVVDQFDLGAILPGLEARLDLTALETAFRDRFFSGRAKRGQVHFLVDWASVTW
jgi:hypothetical protein